ncbi:unnamed protein product, partial [Musa banksii]
VDGDGRRFWSLGTDGGAHWCPPARGCCWVSNESLRALESPFYESERERVLSVRNNTLPLM